MVFRLLPHKNDRLLLDTAADSEYNERVTFLLLAGTG